MSVRIQNLAIEVTRRCNINCTHCLRGNQQNKDIPLEYIDTLLDQINSIGHLSFTGGEPSLNVPAIQYTIDGCKKRNIPIDFFYIATNSVHITQEFVDVCQTLYTLSKHPSACSIQTSNDIYHLKEHVYDDSLLLSLPYYSKRQYRDNDDLIYSGLHKEGRAAKNYPTTANAISIIHKGNFYLNVEGNIIDGCDWSYRHQKSHTLCRVEELEQYKLMA